MNIVDTTTAYERWLGQHVQLVAADLERKHELMRRDALTFLRGTYYRYAERFPMMCPELMGAPRVGAVGDLHVENFGTWRDREGRLVWGVNDLDEADRLPYTVDLVRLSASALLAAEAGRVGLGRPEVLGAVLEGYTRGIEEGAEPVVLGERRRWLTALLEPLMHEPRTFWEALSDLPEAARRLGTGARAALELVRPGIGWKYRLHARTAGVGGLGRPRIVALGEWEGGLVARQLKGVPPPATRRTKLGAGVRPPRIHYGDPWAAERDGWIAQRLAPDNVKLDLALISRKRADRRLLVAMGRETAHYHLGTRGSRDAIGGDLASRPHDWLDRAAEAVVADTHTDYEVWCKR